MTRAGWSYGLSSILLIGLLVHSGLIQWWSVQGRGLVRSADIGDEVWSAESHWWHHMHTLRRSQVDGAIRNLEAADRWGLIATYSNLADLVWLYLARERVDDAEVTVRRLAALAPGAAEPLRGLGGVMAKTGRVEEAETAYRRALSLDPQHDASRRDLCRMLLRSGRIAEGVEVLGEGYGVPRGSGSEHEMTSGWSVELAGELMKSSDLPAARAMLERIVAFDSENGRAHWLLGVTLAQSGDVAKGLEHLRRAVVLEPALGEARYDLGVALLEMGEVREAIVHLQRAAELSPGSAVVQYNLGVAHFMIGELEEAVAAAREAIRLDPSDATARGFLEMVLEELQSGRGSR
jgi:Flp pilus assembly protein TadD